MTSAMTPPTAAGDAPEPDEIEVGGPIPEPTCVATALDRLRAHHQDHGHYDDEHVAALLGLIDTAAEAIAQREREVWAWRLRRMARGSAHSIATCTGLRMAAACIERNRETLT